MRAAEWVAEHLQRLTARGAQRLAASAPVRSGDPAPHYINLSLVERAADARSETPTEALQEVYDLEQLASRDQARILVLGEGGAGKTSSLLHVAAIAAERARVDPMAPVPVYVDLAQLMRIDDVRDLVQLVADAAPPANEDVSLQRIAARRPCLFLFDAFNEVPEQLHRNCVVALRRFVDAWGDRHRYIVGSRAVPGVEPLAQLPSSFIAYNLLRLSADQVESYLDALGLAALHERMPQELRDLARNPFMLVAITRTLAGTAEHDLPRNRGKLYQRVMERWMANEAVKRHLEYHHERVKAPVLSYLAMRMTAAGETSLTWREVEPEIERLLEATYQRIRRRGGMPDDWTVDRCRDEIIADDVLQQAGDRVSFRHQSFQEYFAACWFVASGWADAVVELTPRLVWSRAETAPLTGSLVDVSSHRFVPVLTMMVGLVEDSTKLVEALAERNPVTAAAAIASASRVDAAARAGLEQRWIEMLHDDDRLRRVVACSSLGLVARSPATLRELIQCALDDDYYHAHVGATALAKVSAVNELASQLVEVILALDEERYSRVEGRIEDAVRSVPVSSIVAIAFEHWRAARGDDARRRRLETVLAAVDRVMVVGRLRQIAADTADARRARDAIGVLARVEPRERVSLRVRFLRVRELRDASYAAQRDQETARLKDAGVATLEAALTGGDDATRAGAARVAAFRRMPIGDAVVDALLRVDGERCRRDLIAALVGLLGTTGAIAKLVEASHRDCVWLRRLDPVALQSLPDGWKLEDDGDAVSIRRQVATAVAAAFGMPEEIGHFWVTPSGTGGRSWRVTVQGGAHSQWEAVLSADGLDLYDRSMRLTAIWALAEIGPQALVALREAFERADPEIHSAAIAALARLGDPELADRLLELLGRTSDLREVSAALEALVRLRPPQAIVLIEDLLGMTRGGLEVHPVWGANGMADTWSVAIHRILAAIDAGREVAAAIDVALATGDLDRKCAALRELSRWLADREEDDEPALVWNWPSRGEQLVALALHEPAEVVRREAVNALWNMSSTAVVESVARALDDGDPQVRVAAGRALIVLDASHLHARLQKAMLAVANASEPQVLRRAACDVLRKIPGGLEPIYHPIRLAVERDELQAALDLIAGVLEIIPDDVNLFWWRGRVLDALGQRAQAAASLRRAFELEAHAAAIPPVLAEILIALGDFAGAVEVARRGVDLSEDGADAHALLAWSCYRASKIWEAVTAARMACDLDPVHPRAIWILVLVLLRVPAPAVARQAVEHALRVRQLLSPGLDTSFLATFTEELGAIAAADEATTQLIAELRQRLAAPVQSSL
jgi:HEAT repeat protein